MKKFFWIFGIGFLALIILVAIAVGFYLGPIVKLGMEQVGPKITQVSIKVDAVDVSPLSGSATVKGFIVGNPQGYTTPQAISVGNIAIRLDPLSVTSNKIMIHSIHVESPEITFEGGLSNNNLTKIMDNVNSVSKNFVPASNNSEGQTSGKPAPKIEVDDFLITGAKVYVSLPGLVNKEISLPDIHLTNLGKDSNGLSPAELTSAVLSAIKNNTVNAVASSVSDIAQSVKMIGKGAGNTVGESISKITSGIGGFLGK